MSDENQSNNNLIHCIKNLFNRQSNETVRETIEDLIEDCSSEDEDPLSEHEQLLLNNVLYLKDKQCGYAMIPRAEIIAFAQTGTVGDLAELMVNSGHSRIPIYGDSIDDILGITHVIDLVKLLNQGKQNTKVSEIPLHEIKFVSPSTKVIDLLREMQSNKIHMAAVIDEYGGVDGLVTIEDLLEEIVGDIEDEYDFADQPMINQREDGTITADARAELEEIKEHTGIDLSCGLEENSEIDTLGGLVFNIAQRVPNNGEIIAGCEGISYKIIDADARRIKTVMIIPAKKTEGNAEGKK